MHVTRTCLLVSSLKGLPAATVIAAEIDPLPDQGMAYVQRLKDAGVATTYTLYPGVTRQALMMRI